MLLNLIALRNSEIRSNQHVADINQLQMKDVSCSLLKTHKTINRKTWSRSIMNGVTGPVNMILIIQSTGIRIGDRIAECKSLLSLILIPNQWPRGRWWSMNKPITRNHMPIYRYYPAQVRLLHQLRTRPSPWKSWESCGTRPRLFNYLLVFLFCLQIRWIDTLKTHWRRSYVAIRVLLPVIIKAVSKK